MLQERFCESNQFRRRFVIPTALTNERNCRITKFPKGATIWGLNHRDLFNFFYSPFISTPLSTHLKDVSLTQNFSCIKADAAMLTYLQNRIQSPKSVLKFRGHMWRIWQAESSMPNPLFCSRSDAKLAYLRGRVWICVACTEICEKSMKRM